MHAGWSETEPADIRYGAFQIDEIGYRKTVRNRHLGPIDRLSRKLAQDPFFRRRLSDESNIAIGWKRRF